jgi:hypothetical protein
MVFEGGYYRARGDALKLGAANFVTLGFLNLELLNARWRTRRRVIRRNYRDSRCVDAARSLLDWYRSECGQWRICGGKNKALRVEGKLYGLKQMLRSAARGIAYFRSNRGLAVHRVQLPLRSGCHCFVRASVARLGDHHVTNVVLVRHENRLLRR